MQAGTWYHLPTKASSDAFRNPSPRLVDLVKMSVLAARLGHGDIVWASWQPGGAGTTIHDVKRVNSGTMLVMMTPRGAHTISSQIEVDAGEVKKKGVMKPWHFDLALKQFLCRKDNNDRAKACYIFPPVGNYTQHVSGCDLKHFGPSSAGRPSCWDEEWVCPGTCLAEDPKQRPKKFMRWDGDSSHFEIGDAVVDPGIAGQIAWRSYWTGGGEGPKFRTQEERRPSKVLKRPAAEAAGVEPTATSSAPQSADRKGKGQRPSLTSTAAVVKAMGGTKGRGKRPPFNVWPQRPGSQQQPLSSDPIEQWDPQDEQDTGSEKPTRRQKRNIRGALLMRSFRNWVDDAYQVR